LPLAIARSALMALIGLPLGSKKYWRCLFPPGLRHRCRHNFSPRAHSARMAATRFETFVVMIPVLLHPSCEAVGFRAIDGGVQVPADRPVRFESARAPRGPLPGGALCVSGGRCGAGGNAGALLGATAFPPGFNSCLRSGSKLPALRNPTGAQR